MLTRRANNSLKKQIKQLEYDLEQSNKDKQRLEQQLQFQHSLSPINKKFMDISKHDSSIIQRLYNQIKGVRNTEIANAMKVREASEIEIRDKINIFLTSLMESLSKAYKKANDREIE